MLATEQDKRDIKSIADTDYKRDVILRIIAESVLNSAQITAPEIRNCLSHARVLMKSDQEILKEEKQINPAV